MVREMLSAPDNISAISNGYYTPTDQSDDQGKFITQVGIQVPKAGKISIIFLEGVNTSKGRECFTLTFDVKPDQLWYDVNRYLGKNMYISLCKPGVDTVPFYYTSYSKKSFYFTGNNLGSWQLASGDINLGIKVKNFAGINSYLKNKKISLVGDSISTYWAYNSGQWGRYPIGDVLNPNDTWFLRLLLQSGGLLGVNNSIGGTLVTQLNSTDTGSLQARLNSIPVDTDICLIAMGTNDLGHARDLGNFDPLKSSFDLSIFSDAVCNAIINFQTNYSTTKFIWVTPLKRFDSTIGASPYAQNGQTIQTYTDRLIEICSFYG